MKYTLVLLFMSLSCLVKAQTLNQPLQFNKPFYKYENQWVAFPKNESTGKYPFGVIYIDPMAGFTFQMEGMFQLDATGKVFRDSTDYIKNGTYKYRLERNSKPVCVIPDEMLPALNVTKVPDWLKYYKADLNTVVGKVSWGRHYNHVGEVNHALEYLESAYKTEPHAKGLEFELTYAYNELKQYDKAIDVLNSALKADPNNEMFYRELAYAYKGNKDNTNAIKTYLKGIEMTANRNPQARAEMAWNLAVTYREQKNEDEYKNWGKKAKEWAPANSQIAKHLATVAF